MRRAILLVVLLAGCDSPSPPASNSITATEPTAPAWTGRTGAVTGQVHWTGERPTVVTIETIRPGPGGRADRVSRALPNVPAIDANTGGVGGALIYLQGVAAAARPWTYPPVTLELNDERPMVRQGDGPPRNIGLVRRSDSITIVSKQDRFHALRARGAAFWTFTLPDADHPLTKRLDEPGIVELSSAAGYYWMHAYLFVSEHPYCTVTDAAGRFEMPSVPPGDYELVTWLPSWFVVRRERDPELTAVVRIAFGPHFEWRRPIVIRADESATFSITLPQ